MDTSAVGVVLSGGSGRRLGGPKGRVRVAGRGLEERALAVLDEVFGEVVVSVARRRSAGSGRDEVVDSFAGCGPLAGLEAALAARPGRPVFLLACDLPLVGPRVVRRILAAAKPGLTAGRAAAWLASSAGRCQPLCGLYSAATLPAVRDRLRRRELSMAGLLAEIAVHEVAIDDLGADLLLNVNRPADLARAAELLNGR